MKNLFITGIFRSGTTLLDKLLNSHDKIFIASQPYPELFYSTKSEFLKSKGIQRKYPFDPMLNEEQYRLKDFLEFLVKTKLTNEFLKDLQEQFLDDESDWIQFQLQELTREGDFFTIHRQLINLMSKVYRKADLTYTGSKEILCEEFVPYMAIDGNKAIVVIRDPRDVISSLAFGKSRVYTGDYRPMLYALRMWRKSVAFAIASHNNPDFMFIKYEDLAMKPNGTLKRITEFLGVDPFEEDAYVYGLEDQSGKSWAGNSSFGMKTNIDSSSIGIHKSVLNAHQVKYIETICAPEMEYLGYKVGADKLNLRRLEGISEPTTVLSEGFDENYSFDPANLKMETDRLQKLWLEDMSDEECRKWFIFPSVYQALRIQQVVK